MYHHLRLSVVKIKFLINMTSKSTSICVLFVTIAITMSFVYSYPTTVKKIQGPTVLPPSEPETHLIRKVPLHVATNLCYPKFCSGMSYELVKIRDAQRESQEFLDIRDIIKKAKHMAEQKKKTTNK